MSSDDFDIVGFAELNEPSDAQKDEQIRELKAQLEILERRLETSSEESATKSIEIERLRLEHLVLKQDQKDTFEDVEAFKKALTGSWSIVEARNIDEMMAQGAANLYSAKFQLSDVCMEFGRNKADKKLSLGHVTTSYIVDGKQYQMNGFALSESFAYTGFMGVCYIADNCLHMVKIRSDSKEEEVEKRFLVDEMLHLVIRRNGVECTRIYTKNCGEVEVKCGEAKTGLEARKEALEREMLEMQADPMFIKNRIVAKWENVHDPETIVRFSYVNDYLRLMFGPKSDPLAHHSARLCFVIENDLMYLKYPECYERYELTMEGDKLVLFHVRENCRVEHARIG